MSLASRVYLILVGLAGVAVFLVMALPFHLTTYPVALSVLSVASFFTQVYELEISPRWYLSTHVTIAMTAMYVGGAPLALWVILLSTPPAEAILRWDNLQTSLGKFISPFVFNVAQLIVSVGIAAGMYHGMVVAFPVLFQPYSAMVVAFLAYLLSNTMLVAAIVALSSEERFIRLVRSQIKTYHLQLFTMGSLAIAITTLYEVSPAFLLIALVPLALVHYSSYNFLRLSRDSHLAFTRITELLSERDEYTGDHSEDVERLSYLLADALGLSDGDIDVVRAGAAIHDIGKMAIPDSILKKNDRLTDVEFETMKQHTTIGAEIIENIYIYRNVVPVVRHEHEHWDGSGYPDGIAGEEIPIAARVVAVADVYSALTTERAYRPAQGKPLAYPHEEACGILREMAGTVLDPRLVNVFIESVAPRIVGSRHRGDGTDSADGTDSTGGTDRNGSGEPRV